MVALLGFLALLALLVVGVVTAVNDSRPERDDVPVGVADLAVSSTRTGEGLTVDVPGDPSGRAQVLICPGLLPGPSDAPGMLERIRVSGCVPADRGRSSEVDTWTLGFGSLDDEQQVAFDAAERWLVVVIEPVGSASDAASVAGAWIPGGPILPTAPVLP